MQIGILGVGNIGKTLARKLRAAGHDVTVANSRGPETIEAAVYERVGDGTKNPDAEYAVRLNRASFM